MKKKTSRLNLKKKTIKKLGKTEQKALEGGTIAGGWTGERSYKLGTFGCCQNH